MMRKPPLGSIAVLLFLVLPDVAKAQLDLPQATAQKNDWHPLVYTNLQEATSGSAAYADLWSQELIANNKAYIAKGDFRYAEGNAPAIEAHLVVRSPVKTAIISILDTGTGCATRAADEATGAIVKICPLLIAIYEGSKVTVTRGRKGCFLEVPHQNAASDPANTAPYAAYDVKSKSFRIGTIINHQPVLGCEATIPLYPLPE